jgi:hypothetical protein
LKVSAALSRLKQTNPGDRRYLRLEHSVALNSHYNRGYLAYEFVLWQVILVALAWYNKVEQKDLVEYATRNGILASRRLALVKKEDVHEVI